MRSITKTYVVFSALIACHAFADEPRFPTENHKKYPLVVVEVDGVKTLVPYIQPAFVNNALRIWKDVEQRSFERQTNVVFDAGRYSVFVRGLRDARLDPATQRVRDGHPVLAEISELSWSPNGKEMKLYTVTISAGPSVLGYSRYEQGRLVEKVGSPLPDAYPKPGELPCQARRYENDIKVALANGKLSEKDLVSLIAERAAYVPEGTEKESEHWSRGVMEPFGYRELRVFAVRMLSQRNSPEAHAALVALAEKPASRDLARAALASLGEKRFAPALPSEFKSGDLKTKLKAAYSLWRPEVTPAPEFQEAIRAVAPHFPEIPCATSHGTCKIQSLTFNKLGTRIDGVRFTAPPGKDVHLQGFLAYPPEVGRCWARLVPAKGMIKGVSTDRSSLYKLTDVSWPDNYRTLRFECLGRDLPGDADYILCFAFENDGPAEVQLAVNLFPNVSGGYGSGWNVFGIKAKLGKR